MHSIELRYNKNFKLLFILVFYHILNRYTKHFKFNCQYIHKLILDPKFSQFSIYLILEKE